VTHRASLAAAALIALSAPPLRATPTALFGAGPRSQALGASGAARELGVESVSVNPAFVAGDRPLVLAGFRAARFAIDGVDGGSDGASDALFGLSVPLSPALSLGVITGAPRDLVVRAELPLAEEPQLPLLTGRAHAIDFAAAAGLRWRAWRFGLGLRALAGLEGQAAVVNDADGARTDVRTELEPALAPVLGAAHALGPDDTLALVLRGALEARFDVTVKVGAVGSLSVPDLHVAGSAHYDPAELHGEWRHVFGDTAAQLALTYRRWSAFDSFVDATVQCPQGQPCGALPPEHVELADTLVPRLAVSRDLSLGPANLEGRAGYFYEASPLPEQRGAARRYDNARHVLSLGWGTSFGERRLPRLDFSYQHHFLVPREHRDATISGSVDVVSLALELEL
jgi:long-chain fatty acid transport protein